MKKDESAIMVLLTIIFLPIIVIFKLAGIYR